MTNNGKKKIEYFLDRVCNEYCDDKLPEIQLYEDIANDQLRLIISTMHNRLNKLFSFMYAKA